MKLFKNKYALQGLSLESIAQKFGTPLYVYDGEKIIQQIHHMQKAFSKVNLKIKYAAKALTNLSILKLMRSEGVGMDAVSIFEAKLGLMAGYEPHEILFTPNCVSFNEIKMAVDMGLMINIDNISILEQFGNTYGDRVDCCIRINPHIMAGGNAKISTGHIDSKFGISILQKRHILRVVQTYNIKVTGLHMHTGSDILDAEVFLKSADILYDFARDFDDLQFLDLGSGFKVSYREGDVTTDINALGKALSKSFQDFCEEYGRKLELWFEPGKYLVSEAGVFLVKTNVVKTTPATVFAGVDSGKTGKALFVNNEQGRAIVEGINLKKKTVKRSQDH